MAHDFIAKEGLLSSSKKRKTMARMMYNKQLWFREHMGQELTVVNYGQQGTMPDACHEAREANEFYFHGYCQGLMYKTFGAERFDAGGSGSGESMEIARDALGQGLVAAAYQLMASPHESHQIQGKTLMDYIENVVAKSDKPIFTLIFC